MEPLYCPLRDSEVRLITVEESTGDGVLRCKMDHVPLTQDVEFFALSYVWGDPKDSETILVNEQPFQVTKNLHDFLVTSRDNQDLFRRRYPTTHTDDEKIETPVGPFQWWTDAICINQSDIDEKNAQVPRMGEIYTSALRVWIWLGFPEATFKQDPHFKELKRALEITVRDEQNEREPIAGRLGKDIQKASLQINAQNIIERMRSDQQVQGAGEASDIPELDVVLEAVQAGISEDDIREAAGLTPSNCATTMVPFEPEPSTTIFHRLLRQLEGLMRHAWFERTWTIQEFVLSRNPPIALLGNYSFYLTVLHQLIRDVINERATMDAKSHSYTLSLMPNMIKLFNIVSAYGWRSNIAIDIKGFPSLPPGHKLLHLLRNFTKRQSTVPHDYFYGMLGLLDLPQLPDALTPDYRLPFETVCEEYVKYILESTHDLKIIETFRSDLKGTPSWVADIRYLEHVRQLNTVSTTGDISISADGKKLTVEGVPLGKILLCSCTSCPGDYSPINLAFIGDLMMTSASQITGQPISKIFADWLSVHLQQEFLVPLSVVEGIRSMNDLLRSYIEICRRIPRDVIPILPKLSGPQYAALYETDCINPQLLHVILQLARMRFCLLDTGDICICALKDDGDNVQHGPDDCVWALKGCQNLSILRPAEGGYEYVGFCRIHKADQEYRFGATSAICLDAEYFDSKEVQKVTLV